MSKHGVFVQEEATALTAPITGSCSIPVVVGTAPVNMVQNPEEVINTPILANSAAEAMAALGYVDDFANYSARAGKAKITLGPNCAGNGKAHPYHLIHTDSKSNVYGWVDSGTFD